ncbi:tagatose-bisphosphate aldolase [Pectobacterium parmentieri]|uniref:tagatose-bisphosphate aldolase n=1 Tax=Pectobacterium parmentieri TaxID=1905730 RepID=UPI0001B110DF|nr:tagatose-bisphosphate aldolase [Pectobacterium parmentieri]ACX88016.1 deoxyribose-phosphate aldolase/phospho-2-dehydro-3-deoxyheptonate aldolase [Pectobacterium parmentieri WPP163]MBI0551139.1 tagatose-bisphosphate aldolase [Pectobacterium parmentieri]MBI0560192.1 tagatose-bisphosphate aldolase [Pectobacterium parmentieri]MBI0563854.1 tagatose-bisphosphate aldolase [Pectobacterium parmentieri]PWD66596.1 tagatose-bisphosphate aldolase [Pectobacterium parmentieri]
MNTMTTAEHRGYQLICNATGAMMVIACDQRGGMRTLLAPTSDAQAAITNETLGKTKYDITRYLAAEAGCVLVDPICAIPGLIDENILPRDTGLLIGLDASGWETSPEGYRISTMVEGVTARKVREWGATGGKIMIYLRPDIPDANTRNLETLRAVIQDFAQEDLLLVVEFLTYSLENESREAYTLRLPELIPAGCQACIDQGAKVLKIPYPGSDEACARVTTLCGEIPWAVLSAGVDHATFLPQVESALKNGASGVIAGRSLWKDCISLDRNVSKEKLSTVAVSRLNDIQALLKRYQRP